MTLTVALMLILFIFLCVAYNYKAIRELFRMWYFARQFPDFIKRRPFIGHLDKLLVDSTEMFETLKSFSRETDKLGGVSTAWLGPLPYFIITDPEVASCVQNVCLRKNKLYQFAKSWLGQGLLTADTATWKVHRKLLNPSMHTSILETFLPIVNRQTQKLVRELRVKADGAMFDPWPIVADNTMETLCQTLFGLHEEDIGFVNGEYRSALDKILDIFMRRFQRLWTHPDFLYRFTAMKRDEDKLIEILHRNSYEILERSRFHSEKIARDSLGKKSSAYLHLLLQHQREGLLSRQEVREELDIMAVAGLDTTATALLYILVCVGSRPLVQETLFQEIDQVLGRSFTEVQWEHLPRLVYTRAVILEVLRLHPVIPAVIRVADSDVVCKNHLFPAGSNLFVLIWGVNRCHLWEDPDAFRPERWLSPGALPPVAAAFASFSLGKRGCLGKAYAMMTMKISLAAVISRYRVRADESRLRQKMDVLLKPVSGCDVSLEEREAR